MNALSLFSGIGGLDLAAEWAGFKTVAFCERDPFCQKVLEKHWPGVKIYDDVRTINTGELPAVDIVFGGYPCQPFSTAGNRKGLNDERFLWPEMLRVVRETNPTWVVGENVKGHITLGLDTVLNDLAESGYTARAFCYPACAIGANHERQRIFVVAHTSSDGRDDSEGCASYGEATDARRQKKQNENFNDERCSSVRAALERGGCASWGRGVKPGIRRIRDGIPDRVDRLRSLGNAVVPQQAYPIFAAIAETYNV